LEPCGSISSEKELKGSTFPRKTVLRHWQASKPDQGKPEVNTFRKMPGKFVEGTLLRENNEKQGTLGVKRNARYGEPSLK
jgi:hypothetical protein